MTLKRLEQYPYLKCEVDTLRRRLADVQEKSAEPLFDTVQASMADFPYVRHTVTVRGMGTARIAKYKTLAAKYAARAERLVSETVEIENWIDTIQDSRVRNIVELRFIEGRSWNAAARRVYGHPCGDTARMLVKRYCEKI